MGKHPKPGEKRQKRMPLKIDRLPQEFCDRICRERERNWKSWPRIEEETPQWPEWEQVEPAAAALFPGRRVGQNTLARWYDLRVEQVRTEVQERATAAIAWAQAFKARQLKGLDQAAVNAMRDIAFSLAPDNSPQARKEFFAKLDSLSSLLVRLKRIQLDKEKFELQKTALLEARDNRAGGANPRELYLDAAQDVLKKLRTREPVREILDPIREELIAEFAHGAEAYAKSVEARTA